VLVAPDGSVCWERTGRDNRHRTPDTTDTVKDEWDV